LSKLGRKRSQKKARLVRLGQREIETLGLRQRFWSDLYHRSMTVSWPVFFGSAASLFVALNAVFGFLYSLGHEPIANAAQNGPLAYFYFSIETLATVGYGDMHPRTNYGPNHSSYSLLNEGGRSVPKSSSVLFSRPNRLTSA